MQLCQRAFLAPLHNWCANCWAAVMRHNIRLLARCFNAALRACTHVFMPPGHQRRVKPDTKWPPLRGRELLHAAFQSSFLRWTGDFRGRRRLVKNSRPRTILSRFFYALTHSASSKSYATRCTDSTFCNPATANASQRVFIDKKTVQPSSNIKNA